MIELFALFLALGQTAATLCVSSATNACIPLTWTASTTPGVTYNVYRETVAGACANGVVGMKGTPCAQANFPTPIAALTFTDSVPPTPGTQVWYVVRAAMGTVESANSNEVTLTFAPAPPGTLTCPGAVVISGGAGSLTAKCQ